MITKITKKQGHIICDFLLHQKSGFRQHFQKTKHQIFFEKNIDLKILPIA